MVGVICCLSAHGILVSGNFLGLTWQIHLRLPFQEITGGRRSCGEAKTCSVAKKTWSFVVEFAFTPCEL